MKNSNRVRERLLKSERRKRRFSVFKDSSFYYNLEDFISLMRSHQAAHPDKKLYIEQHSERYYGEIETTIEVFYEDFEDIKETEIRVDRMIEAEKARRKEEKKKREENDYKEYQRLKKKYEKTQ